MWHRRRGRAPCGPNPDPDGYLDQVSSPGPGLVTVRGWAYDPNDGQARVRIHVYVGGPAGSGARGYDVGPTWQARPDVHAAHPAASGYAGFETTVPSPGGNVPVYVYAINVGPGDNAQVGTKTVAVTAGPSAFPGPASGFTRVSRTGKAVHLAWAGLGNRPSAVTFDVRYRSRATAKRVWGTWQTGWSATTSRDGSLTGKSGRTYQFQVRTHSDTTGAGPGAWSGAKKVAVPKG